MRLGYNTNGFAHHRLEDALDLIAETGYTSVGYTVDVHHPPPDDDAFSSRGLLPVIETGARFLLDPSRKHFPTLCGERRQERVDFYFRCVDLAARYRAPCLSLWSGQGDDWGPLLDGLARVCDRADAAGVDVAFEPEPGMFVATMAQYDELRARLPHDRLKLTIDVGHLRCLEKEAPGVHLDRYRDQIRNVHLDDHREGRHEHLMFGEGEIDWPPLLRQLHLLGAEIPATVELSRHSHDAVASCRQAYLWLTG